MIIVKKDRDNVFSSVVEAALAWMRDEAIPQRTFLTQMTLGQKRDSTNMSPLGIERPAGLAKFTSSVHISTF